MNDFDIVKRLREGVNDLLKPHNPEESDRRRMAQLQNFLSEEFAVELARTVSGDACLEDSPPVDLSDSSYSDVYIWLRDTYYGLVDKYVQAELFKKYWKAQNESELEYIQDFTDEVISRAAKRVHTIHGNCEEG